MNKIQIIPIALLLLMTAACSMQNNKVNETTGMQDTIASDKKFLAVMKIKDSIKVGDSVLLHFTVFNNTDSVKKFLKWQTPFEPLMSKYLDVKNEQGEEVQYKGAMAKRMMPPPADAYLTLNPGDSLNVKVDLLKGYDITKPGKYSVAYTSEEISGLKVDRQVEFVYY